MSQFLFAAWEGGGAVPPTLDLAGALVRRGHDVRVIGDPVLREEVEAVGAEFRPWTRAPHRTDRGPDSDLMRDWEAKTPLGMFARVRDGLIVGPAREFAEDVLAEHDRRPADAIVAEIFLQGALIAAEVRGIPHAGLSTTINPLPTDGVPPFGPGLAPARGPLGRARDAALHAMTRRVWATGRDSLNATRAHFGLAPVDDLLDSIGAVDPLLVLSPRALEYASARPAPNVHHVGPRLLDPAWAGTWVEPPGEDPLVLVGLSSTYQQQEPTLRSVVAALSTLPVRGVVTTGPAVDAAALDAGANVQVVESAPHGEILPRARAVVTHGGHGTVVKALAHGLPLVVLPMGRDQEDVAARVAAHGAGIRLKRSASPAKVAAAVRRVLDEPSFAPAAQRLAAAIAADLARDQAADALEAIPRTVASTTRAQETTVS